MAEFLVTIDWSGLYGLPDAVRDALVNNERDTGLKLIEDGVIKHIWEIPGEKKNIGIWSVESTEVLMETLQSLPIYPHVRIEVRAVAVHPLFSNKYDFIIGREVI